jgi:uncharacterized protein (DUF1697 family)
MTATKTFVALLRGVNVGGRSMVPMAELRTLLSSLGLQDVQTYIQSGNVVFRAPGTANRLAPRIERELAAGFDVEPAVILRTPAELERIARSNPYLTGDADVSKLHVVFLDRPPTKRAVAKLDPDRSPSDELTVARREIYLHLPKGAGRTKLTLDYLERTLGVRGTQRSWKTLLKLIELSRP